jgi:Fe-S cluster assembly iron-binding protein IscA
MLALDEPGENDETYEKEGFTFIVGKDLMKRLEKIFIDSNEHGFLISSPLLEKVSCSSGSCS